MNLEAPDATTFNTAKLVYNNSKPTKKPNHLDAIDSPWLIGRIEERIEMLQDYFFSSESAIKKKARLGDK